jgi:transposase
MVRRVLTDVIWEQLKTVLRLHKCQCRANNREIMEAILWKLRTGAPWRDVPSEFCPWKTAYNRFNRWAKKGLWENFFTVYEAKLIQSGYSSMEVMFALTSMRVELGMVKSGLLENPEEGLPQKFIWPPMRMEIRSILKSLGVKFTTQSPLIR